MKITFYGFLQRLLNCVCECLSVCLFGVNFTHVVCVILHRRCVCVMSHEIGADACVISRVKVFRKCDVKVGAVKNILGNHRSQIVDNLR